MNGGVESLKQLSFHQPTSELEDHRENLEAHFRENPPMSAAQAIDEIQRLTGVKRGLTQTRTFLHRLGLDYRKVGAVPAKVDPEVQEEFIREELEPRLKEARDNERVVFFVDAAHFVMGAFLGWLWCHRRIFVRSSAGRKRFNVLGALCATTHRLFTVCNTDYINSSSVCDLLNKIRQAYPVSMPITIVLDNARYQRCKLVQDTAKEMDIELLFLPTYSPNLNLIERLWKFTKKKVLYSKYYENFADFQAAITGLLDTAHKRYATELQSLLTHKFQTFEV